MNGIIHFETFLLAAVLLNLAPGNDTIFILTKSMGQGRKAGIMSALGIGTGSVIHTILAAFGLSVIITKSILIFNIIKYAGAAYLVYIGIKMLFDKTQWGVADLSAVKKINYLKIYRDAVVTNVLNPKVALFFIAFLPQFIIPGSHNTVWAFLVLGITFTCTGTTWCLILASFASVFFDKLKRNKKIAIHINRVCGTVMIALGIKVALTNRK